MALTTSLKITLESFTRPFLAATFATSRSFSAEEPGKPVKIKSKKWAKHKVSNYHLENKLLFGDMVESQREKNARLKREKQFGAKKGAFDLEIDEEAEAKAAEIAYVQKASPDHVRKLQVINTARFPRPEYVIEKKRAAVEVTQPQLPLSIKFQPSSTSVRYPSVTKILSDTLPPEQKAVLEKWEAKMKADLGEEGFIRLKNSILTNGRDLHENIQKILSGTKEDELSIPLPIRGHWRSVRSVLFELTDVRVLESQVIHPSLNYCGIVDCVAHFKDCLVCIDWKTSGKPKPVISMTYDAPLQVAAYIGALNEDPNYDLEIREGLIVVAYESGQPCETYFLTERDVSVYWAGFEHRLNQFKKQRNTAASQSSSER